MYTTESVRFIWSHVGKPQLGGEESLPGKERRDPKLMRLHYTWLERIPDEAQAQVVAC